VVRKVLHLRRKHGWGADHIAHDVGLAASIVQRILRAEGVRHIDRGDRATREPVRRRVGSVEMLMRGDDGRSLV